MSIRIHEPIHLFGVGCAGSRVAELLSEKGPECVSEMHAWDGGIVDLSNTRWQKYRKEHIGLPKVDALRQQVRSWGGIDLVTHPHHVTESVQVSGIAILGVDKMSARWNLWEHSIRKNRNVSLMIEVRMETTGALIHVIDPNNDAHVYQWERYWYPDEESTTAGLSCGAATSFGPISDLVASLSVWQLIRAVSIRNGSNDRLDNQIRISMTPLKVETYQW